MEGTGGVAQPELNANLETPSGKGRRDENFPVGSWLIRRDLRPHVHAFYRFAREADDIADNGDLAPEEKVRRLKLMGAILDGAPSAESPAALAMRQSLKETGATAQHCHDVLRAFIQDATKRRYRDWDDLMSYCRYSATPVGRHVLDLHGESRVTWEYSDPLCDALQVLNHLQDCVADYRNLDRVYLPEDDLAACGSSIADLTKPRATPGLRRVVDRLLDGTDTLIAKARGLPGSVAATGLRRETAVIVTLAEKLARRLRRGDPVAGRVALTALDFATALPQGLWRGRRRGHA
jgi:farnesyl-diphosphate farnesyltransferase